MGNLTQNFNRSEFACKDGCGFDGISVELVRLLQLVRSKLNIPLPINAGCRCVKHNAEVGGKPNSAHLRGLAADIGCINGHTRYLLLVEFMKMFKRIEVGDKWLHVDIDPSLPQEVVFLA